MSEIDFRAQFPYFSLENKAGVKGDGNVMSTSGGSTLKVYARRTKGGKSSE